MRLSVEAVMFIGYDSVAIGYGRSEEGRLYRFAGEPRCLHEISLALDEGEEVGVEVEGWAILGEVPDEMEA